MALKRRKHGEIRDQNFASIRSAIRRKNKEKKGRKIVSEV